MILYKELTLVDMRHILPILLVLAGMLGVRAQQTRLLTPDKYSDYGLVYTLPNTAFEVELTARHTLRQAGPYRQFAPKYTGTDKVITADSESWDITGVRLRSYGVANDSAIYRMQLKAGQTLTLCVADDGMLLGVNAEAEPLPDWEPLDNPEPMQIPSATEYLQYVGADFSSAQSDARRAALLAAGLNDVRQARLDLTRGTADNMPTDGAQLDIMLNSLAHQEELLLNAFRGREMTETRTARFSLVPDNEGRYVLARLNPYTGFVNRDDLSGTPIYLDIEVTEAPEVPVDDKGQQAKLPRDGIMYMLPGTARISIQWQGRELYSGITEMAQYGIPFALDPSLFSNKKAPAAALFNPATGALRSLGEMKSDSIN